MPIRPIVRLFVLSLLPLLAAACDAAGDVDGEPCPIEAGAVTASGPVTLSGAVTAGAVSAGEVAAGDVVAEGVVAGDVEAGDVFAGAVAAGDVAAGAVAAGDVTAGDITAGDVTATGSVELTGPVTASGGLGIPIGDVQVVASLAPCFEESSCSSAATTWTTAIQGACAGGTLEAFQFAQTDGSNQTLVAIIDCP